MIYLWLASRPRCGSHWLGSLLGSVPGCYVDPEEPFHFAFTGTADFFWDGQTPPAAWLQQDAARVDRLAGWIVHHSQLLPGLVAAVRPVITHVLVLYRRDVLAQQVSRRLAESRDDWRTDSSRPPSNQTLYVSEAEFRDWARDNQASILDDRRAWMGYPLWTAAYEDLYDLQPIGEWLGIDLSGAVTATHRRESRPLWRVVENYQEARRWAAEMAVEDLPCTT